MNKKREIHIEMTLPSDYRIFVSKAEYVEVIRETDKQTQNFRVFMRIQNAESIKIEREGE